MNTLAILIPTYGRSGRLANLVENIHKMTTTSHTIYIICESDDPDTFNEAKRLNEQAIMVSDGTYVAAVNTGYRSTTEPFLLLGADDIEFTKGWDIEMLRPFTDPSIGIVGHQDEWIISQTQKHGSHLMVRREYIEKYSGVLDTPNVIYCPYYIHIMCDIETEQTAMKRNAFAMSQAFIKHNHWYMKTAEMDKTYERAIKAQDHDMVVYNQRRKMFEVYLFEELFKGNVVMAMKDGLTVVIPSLNKLPYLKQTVESLQANTKTPYELIIIDDHSNQETINYIRSLDCVKVFNEKQKYVNANWNEGIRLATNRFVCIANNDITFSKGWDLPLIRELQKEDVWIASPFQTDDGYSGAYGKHERSGNIDLRGCCFMINKAMIRFTGLIPQDLLIWFGDWWLTWVVQKNGKKCVFNSQSVVHHYGSQSSIDMMQERNDLFHQILRGDAYAFVLRTGINVDHFLKIIYKNLNLPCPV